LVNYEKTSYIKKNPFNKGVTILISIEILSEVLHLKDG
jgi:hypothetical protein